MQVGIKFVDDLHGDFLISKTKFSSNLLFEEGGGVTELIKNHKIISTLVDRKKIFDLEISRSLLGLDS